MMWIIQNTTGPIDYDSIYNIKQYLEYGEPDSAEVQVIDFDCAVFISPSREQIDEMGPSDYNMGRADYAPREKEQRKLCASNGIKIIKATRKYLEFRNSDRYYLMDIRKKGMPAWNVVLYKSGKSPFVPTGWLTAEMLNEYFGTIQ